METTMYIRKNSFGFEYNETLTPGETWRSLPTNIKTRSDIMDYFQSGGHRNVSGGRFDPPRLQFVNAENQPVNHYSVRISSKGLHTALENLDTSKVKSFETADIWPEASQIKYLRAEAIHLPSEIKTIPEAVKYLTANEPLTLDDFYSEVNKRMRQGIEERLNSGPTKAAIEFIE